MDRIDVAGRLDYLGSTMISASIEAMIERACKAALDSQDDRKIERVELMLKDAAVRLGRARYEARQAAFRKLKGSAAL